ncbi:YdcF family protein [Selenihalanaerobacter shriftii]|uniref:Uncharacterized SAM-binding protein YcdF, DUF218 family n=1 Tax=Selenihalanaerobacter shriftii TaxID=142842 RepID=A0A1T4JKD4_9FIRM|nr:YdcF family protein [Selenihalanaerobacter shriftii]SJZ30604.1 Uncharacterized SAM-binding protein YcdF, DUF218 family [Selenihalanaerobacter shriftii]
MMLFVVKMLSKLLLPPGLFLILIGIIFVLYKTNNKKYCFRKSRQKCICNWLIILFLLMYILSSYPGELILVKPLEDNFAPLSVSKVKTKVDLKSAIVVLGGGVIRGTPNGMQIGRTTLKRLYSGWRLHKKTGLKLVVSGGVVPGAKSGSVAETMKKVLKDWGVADNQIITENESKNTWQNAVNTSALLKDLDYEKIILVTSATHMKRSMYSFKKNWKSELKPAPADYILDRDISILDFLPNKESLDNSLTALHEWVGLLWYLI